MKEIWQVSHSPLDHELQKGSVLLGSWWALWLISNFVGQWVLRLSLNADTIDKLRDSTDASILLSIISIFLYLVLVNLIKSIANKQEQLVNNG